MEQPGPAARLVEIVRHPLAESVHRGHVAIWRHGEGLIGAWGDPATRILPRSAIKMIQALPLVESGAADRAGLTDRQLALACASHEGAAIHTDLVTSWLAELGRTEADLRCGPQWPGDEPAAHAMIRTHRTPDQRHNNCSGKHTGFLTLSHDLGAGPEYLEIDHPVQVAVRAALGETTEEACEAYAIDGCSAPNFAITLTGFARALARFAAAPETHGARGKAMVRLVTAMVTHPEYVAGDGRACTRLMHAMGGRAAVKTGAEGVFAAIVPELRLGMAVKIEDGAGRASEAVIAALLVRAGVLAPDDPEARRFMHGPILNRRGIETGHLAVSPDLMGWTP
jgi:L-asparaginase II